MGFDQSAFIIAGTGIAIAGVGLYLWDTRGKNLISSGSSGSSQPQGNYGYDPYGRDSGSWIQGGRRRSRKNKRNMKNKTKKH
jgi:hypothetical protein